MGSIRVAATLAVLALFGAACARPAPPPSPGARTIDVGGRQRSYLEHIPARHESHPPLVLVLHGRGGSGAGTEADSGFDAAADANGFIAAYPDGVRHSWADGRGEDPADRLGVDDVGFLTRLIADVEARDKADPHRVFVTGISNGGFLTERMACDRADLVAAVAPVAATIGKQFASTCRPSRPVSVMDIHGTADPLVPYAGGVMTVLGASSTIISAQQVFAGWTSRDECTGAPTKRALPVVVKDGTSITVTSAAGCPARVGVELWTVVGGGHTWPGGTQYLSERLVGKVSHQVSAPKVIWSFFAAHGR